MTGVRPTADLTVVILTRDEARNLPGALASLVPLAPARVRVVDCGSTDGTVALAQAWGCEVVQTAGWPGFVEQRNRALEGVVTGWVFYLDADERLSAEGSAELARTLSRTDVAGLRVRRRNWYLGSPLRAWGPDPLVRGGRVGRVCWEGGRVHEVLRVHGAVADLTVPLLHDSYVDLPDQHTRHVRYAALWAQTRHERGQRFRAVGLFAPVGDLFKHYVVKGAWREGRRGWMYALSYAVYALQKRLFHAALELEGGEPFPRPEGDPPPLLPWRDG